MQGVALAQRQNLRAIPVQIQANAILNMNLIELQQFIETEAMENPALGIEESARCPVCGFLAGRAACPVCGAAAAKPEPTKDARTERDYLERAYSAANLDDTFDPFRAVASADGLADYLKQQARISLGGRKLRIAEFLIDSLDDDGYFRESLYETAEEFAAAVPEVEAVLQTLQSFDPPGIAARDLRECLLLQIRSLGSHDPDARTAERILDEHWEDFSKVRFKTIARRTEMSLDEIRAAAEFIRSNLTPHPASAYHAAFDALAPQETAAVAPDVVIHRRNDDVMAEVVDRHGPLLRIDETYESVYDSIKCGGAYLSEDDLKHVREHVERVRLILDAIALRKKTLARVADHLVDYQKEFLLRGPSKLRPLRQKDVAKTLGVHESTICRALAGKYCRLPSGEVVSFDMFFDSALPIRNMINQLIARSAEPMSDGEIAKRLAEEGINVARRTVAKYREQLRLLPYQLRAA